MKIGSVNIDHVDRVDHFVRPGETLFSRQYATFAGGKGFKQSIALARAGAPIRHVGRVGRGADDGAERRRLSSRRWNPLSSRHSCIAVPAVDTTAAGDKFIGYFLAEMMRSAEPGRALAHGCHAAAICVTRAQRYNNTPATFGPGNALCLCTSVCHCFVYVALSALWIGGPPHNDRGALC